MRPVLVETHVTSRDMSGKIKSRAGTWLHVPRRDIRHVLFLMFFNKR